MGSWRVGHDWATSLSLFTFMHWRGKWQPTPVFLPRESQGWGHLVRCHLWGRRVGHDWSDLAAAAAAHGPKSSVVAQMVKILSAMQETWVHSLSQEDPLEKGMVNHSSVLAWRIPWTGKPGGLQSIGSQRVRYDLETNAFISMTLRRRQPCQHLDFRVPEPQVFKFLLFKLPSM